MKDHLPHEGLVSFEQRDGGSRASLRFIAFNTSVDFVAFGLGDRARAELEAAMGDCRTYERLFSRTIPSSDVGRLNAAGGCAIEIDPRTADLLLKAMGYCEASEGAFDITVGALADAWNFKEGTAPSSEALQSALAHVGMEKLSVWAECGGRWRARLSDAQAMIDLGGIAKGWIADKVAEALMGSGARGCIVNLGGNVIVKGSKPDGSLWRLGIREPKPSAEDPHILAMIEVEEGSLVTSGVYERGFDRAGVRYHHILDPRSGMPVETPWAAVSVLAEKSIDAEGFSTTLLAIGLERSRALAARHPEIEQAYFTAPDGAIELLRP